MFKPYSLVVMYTVQYLVVEHFYYVYMAEKTIQPFREECCSTTGKPTRSFATERVSLDSV
jgi:hypothetical protein